MSDAPEKIRDEQLELYLDGQLSAEEIITFEEQLTKGPDALRAVEADREVNQRIRLVFTPPSIDAEQIHHLIATDVVQSALTTPRKRKSNRRNLMLVSAAVAASIALAVALTQREDPKAVQPFFEPRALTTIYQETIEQGFRPYYFCEDDQRFAMTFLKRQQVAMRLAPMPEDRRMAGLSYLGGLSRDTTAMLCYFQDQPVVVFVDRVEVDNRSIGNADPNQKLNSYRLELGELVIYEISPLSESKFAEFLQLQ